MVKGVEEEDDNDIESLSLLCFVFSTLVIPSW